MRLLIAAVAATVLLTPIGYAGPPADADAMPPSRETSPSDPQSDFASWYAERPYHEATAGDVFDGEDLRVRQIAIEALGSFNGSVVVADAENGRVLTLVNQKLALSSGFMPCSTIKPVIGLAALNEGIVEPGEKVWFDRRTWTMNMVDGLAISNNVLFDYLGEQLGFERVRRYARTFGLGEKAGWDIPGEQLGEYPSEEHPNGVGRMSSFGDGISMTPLQLAAFAVAMANGGTLYYLQHPLSPQQAEHFESRVKRYLPIAPWLPEIEEGMRQAVQRGTAKNARAAGQSVWGKTGTCSQYHRPSRQRIRLGWFGSFNEVAGRKLAIVVLLRGGWGVVGPRAAEVAGEIYRGLGQEQYFTTNHGGKPNDTPSYRLRQERLGEMASSGGVP